MSEQVLNSVPALGPLFAKAILARRRAGDALAEDRLTVADQPIDADRLRRYQQVCGFRVSDRLPPTYLHLMAFPLAVARMARPDFPFPLLGLVHVGNVLRQVRPVTAAEAVSLSVWAANLRPHPAGQQVDLVSEASVAGELVWSEASSYLHRSAGGERASSSRPERAVPTGPAIRWQVPADTGRRYAAVSGDRNPIHLHNLTAKAFGFRAAIAHGLWLKARTLAAFEGRLPAAFTVEVAFKTPVFLPAQVELIASANDVGWQLDVHDPRTGKPHLTGSIDGGADG